MDYSHKHGNQGGGYVPPNMPNVNKGNAQYGPQGNGQYGMHGNGQYGMHGNAQYGHQGNAQYDHQGNSPYAMNIHEVPHHELGGQSQSVPNQVYMNQIKRGSWEAGLFDCCTHCVPNCCMTYFFPCVSVAQIISRLGWGSYFLTLIGLILLYFISILLDIAMANSEFEYRDPDTWDVSNSDSYHGRKYYIWGPWKLWGGGFASLFNFVLAIIVFRIRHGVRKTYDIPGSCLFDICFAFCCTCCAIAQVATHVKSYQPRHCDFGPPDTIPAYQEH